MMQNRERGNRFDLFVSLLLAGIVVGGIADLILDAPRGWTLHVILEVALILLSLGSASYLAWGWYQTQGRLEASRLALVNLEEEQHAWEKDAQQWLTGLRHSIEEQLDQWGLTPAERATALMLLKGHSHKQIAALASKSERTVRQQAVAVYRKSTLGGRAELAAFFLDGLFLPGAGKSP
jgi:DNA-binding CsgD family transcriptional regulator